jgi:hypothetical protein
MFILLVDKIDGNSILVVVFELVVKVDEVAFVFVIEFDSELFNLDDAKPLPLFMLMVAVEEED